MRDTLGRNLHINSGFCLSDSDLIWNKGLMSAIRRVQNSECRDRGSPINMSSKMYDQRHRIQIFYIITVSFCQLFLQPPSFFLCNGPWRWSCFLWWKSALELEFQRVTVRVWLASFGRSPCWSVHCHIRVVMINWNQHISWWLTWNREEFFKAFLREIGVHWLKEFTRTSRHHHTTTRCLPASNVETPSPSSSTLHLGCHVT